MFELMRQINQTLIGTSWVRLPLAAKYLAIISLSIVIIKFMNGSKKIEEILLEWWTARSPRIPAPLVRVRFVGRGSSLVEQLARSWNVSGRIL